MRTMINRRRAAQGGSPATNYLMTATSNPEVFPICVAQGWCSAEGMTYEDARKVTSIPIDTFSGNTDIVSFDELKFFTGLKNGLIGDEAATANGVFQNCTSLKSVNLPDNIKKIGAKTFSNCTSLMDVKIPNGVTHILESSFYGTPLVRVEIPSTVTNIGYGVFRYSPNVQYVKVLATTPPTLSKNNFIYDNYTNVSIYVPDESVELYKAANNWSELAGRIKPLSEFVEPQTS
jgi:hypothetical protein